MTTLESQLEARAKWDSFTAAGMRYARSCRNREKRAYAVAYLAYLLHSPIESYNEPNAHTYDLSYMGAQAVRLSLNDIREAVV